MGFQAEASELSGFGNSIIVSIVRGDRKATTVACERRYGAGDGAAIRCR